MAEGDGEGGVLRLGARIGSGANLGIKSGDEDMPAGEANKVKAVEGYEERDVILDGRGGAAVDARGGGARETVGVGEDCGWRERRGGVEWRDGREGEERAAGGVVGGGLARSGCGTWGRRRGHRSANALVAGLGQGGGWGAGRVVEATALRAGGVGRREEARPAVVG